MNKPIVAVITPYYDEKDEQLRRVMESVRAQRYPHIRHYMVADGHPKAVVADNPHVRHVPFPVSHRDDGNSPRGLGSISAINHGADIVCYLDADNAYLPDHVESVVDVLADGVTEVAAAYRLVHTPEEPELWMAEDEDLARVHVDVNCYAIHRRAARLTSVWAMVPKAVSIHADRYMLATIRAEGVRMRWTGLHTVIYEGRWGNMYARTGKVPPAHAQTIDMARIVAEYDPIESVRRVGRHMTLAAIYHPAT